MMSTFESHDSEPQGAVARDTTARHATGHAAGGSTPAGHSAQLDAVPTSGRPS